MNNIVLIGYRGTGKSSVADRIARATGRAVMHMDAEIVARAGRSIPDIVAAEGWPAFRDIESAIVREAALLTDCVLDTGGGVVEREENMRLLKQSGVVFWLQAAPDAIRARIGDAGDRPSLTGETSFTDEIDRVLARRTPVYARHADHAVATDGRTPDEIAQEILDILNLRPSQ